MYSIILKVEAVSEARHLVVLGYVDSDWSKIGLSKVEHDFVTSKLAIEGALYSHQSVFASIFIECLQENLQKVIILRKQGKEG